MSQRLNFRKLSYNHGIHLMHSFRCSQLFSPNIISKLITYTSWTHQLSGVEKYLTLTNMCAMWRCVWREWFEFLGPSFFVNLVITGDLKNSSEPAHILRTALQDFLLFLCIFFGHRDLGWKSQQALVHSRKITLQRLMLWTAQFAGFGERLANPLVEFQNKIN